MRNFLSRLCLFGQYKLTEVMDSVRLWTGKEHGFNCAYYCPGKLSSNYLLVILSLQTQIPSS